MLKQTTNILAMKKNLLFAFLFAVTAVNAQTEKDKVISTMRVFHQALVEKNSAVLNQHMDDALSYGHSSGWIQSKSDVVKDFESGMISYQVYKADSVQVAISGDAANVRFLADVTVTQRGNTSTLRLRVLEIWIKRNGAWVIFARQAIRG
jgi:hypothetical protein